MKCSNYKNEKENVTKNNLLLFHKFCIDNKIFSKVLLEKINVEDLATAEKAPIDIASVCKNSETFVKFTIKARILKKIDKKI